MTELAIKPYFTVGKVVIGFPLIVNPIAEILLVARTLVILNASPEMEVNLL